MDKATNNTSAALTRSRSFRERVKKIFSHARFKSAEHTKLPNDEYGYSGEISEQSPRQPDSVVFDSFTAECEGRRITLRWHTRRERDLLGFDIYRADDESGENIRVNSKLIVARGNALHGEWYSLVDEIDGNDRNFCYTLGAIDYHGKLFLSNPAKVTLPQLQGDAKHRQGGTSQRAIPAEVSYSVKADGNVGVQLYNVAGRLVKNLYSGFAQEGTHRLLWDGTDENGAILTSGVYFLKTNMSEYITTRKVVLVDTVLRENRISRVLCEREKQWENSESADCTERGEALQ